MNKFIKKIQSKIDITIEDLVVCPIDDHMTIGVQMFLPQIIIPEVPATINDIIYVNNIIYSNYLIL